MFGLFFEGFSYYLIVLLELRYYSNLNLNLNNSQSQHAYQTFYPRNSNVPPDEKETEFERDKKLKICTDEDVEMEDKGFVINYVLISSIPNKFLPTKMGKSILKITLFKWLVK